MKINLGSIQIPINGATKTFALLAKRGAGKSYTGAVMAEELHKNNVPFVVFDPIDVWWGLRLAKDGKSKGLPVVVFGLEHADIPLTRDMGREIAQAIVQENVSCVISTFGMPKVAQRHLIAEFAEELLNINNIPRHIFIEEAHEFVPQRVFGALGKTSTRSAI
jgi:DNA helicase HerA-like ATPase